MANSVTIIIMKESQRNLVEVMIIFFKLISFLYCINNIISVNKM